MRLFLLNSFLNLIRKSKPLLIVQMAPPTYVQSDSNNFKSESAPSLF